MPKVFRRRGFAVLVLACAAALSHAQSTGAASGPGYSGPIFDVHKHVRFADSDSRLVPTHPVGVDAIRAVDAQTGVTRSSLIVIARRGDPEGTRQRNDRVVAAAKASEGHFIPIASVHPLDGDDALTEVSRLAALGVRVIKLHPNTQNFDVADPAVDAVAKRCGQVGVVILIDSYKPWDPAQLGKLLILSLQNPQTKFILAHMGFSQFRETLSFAEVRKLGMGGNVWFDLSAIGTAYADSPVRAELVWTMRTIGIDRMLFASDWPIETPAEAIKAALAFDLRPDEQRKFFYDNAAQLIEGAAAPAAR